MPPDPLKLVLQHPHPAACQQACYAMLAGQTLDDVIQLVGPNRLGVEEREKLVKAFGLKLDVWKSIPVAAFGDGKLMKSLAPIMREATLLCSVNDYRDVYYGHAVVIHNSELYDPACGINPMWPWSRVISHVQPVQL